MAVKPTRLDIASNPLTANQGVGPSIIDTLMARGDGSGNVDPIEAEKQSTAASFVNQAQALGLDPVEVSRAFESGDPQQINAIRAKMQSAVPGPEGPKVSLPAVVASQPIQPSDPDGILAGVRGELKNSQPDIVVSANRPTDSATTRTVGEMVRTDSQSSPVINPFKVGKDLRETAASVADGIDNVFATSKRYDAATERLVQTTNEVMPKIFERKQAINDIQRQEENVFRNRIQPALDKKAKIDDRIIQLEVEGKGNIFKQVLHAVKGLVDDNYNPDALKLKSDSLGGAIASVAQSYSLGSAERAAEYDLLDRQAKALLAPAEMDVANEAINLRSDTSLLQASQQGFNFLGDLVSTNSAVAAAQVQKTSQFLAEQTDAEISQLVGKARQNNGVLEIGGVRVTDGQLEEQSQRRQQQNMALRSAALALRSNELGLHEQQMDYALKLMSVEQLSGIRSKGYMLNGMKVPPIKVDALINDGLVGRKQMADRAAAESDVGVVNNMGRQYLDGYNALVGRVRSTTGSVAPLKPLIADTAATTQKIKGLWERAAKEGTVPETARIVASEIARLQQRQEAAIGGMAMQMADGDKTGAGFIGRFLKGDSFNPQDAYAFSAWANERGGLPSAMRLNQPAQIMLKSYRQAQAKVTDDLKAKGVKLPAAQKEQMVFREFLKSGSKGIADFSTADIQNDLPNIAKKYDHPFAGVGAAGFAQARAAGDQAGLRAYATQMGIPPEIAQRVWTRQYDGPDRAEIFKRETPQIRQAANAASNVGTLEALDALPQAKNMKMRPSDAYIDFLHDPRLHSEIPKIEDHGRALSPGGAMANSLARGSASLNFGNTAKSLAVAQSERIAAQTAGSFMGSNRYATDGVYKLKAILGAMPNLNQQEEAQLIDAVARSANANKGPADYMEAIFLGRNRPANFGAVSRIITGTKFEDPGLERLRKLVAPKLNEEAERMDRAVERLGKGD